MGIDVTPIAGECLILPFSAHACISRIQLRGIPDVPLGLSK
jgi:hypothetical protein